MIVVMFYMVCSQTDRIIIDIESVLKAFKMLSGKKANGPDNMSALPLKTCAEELSPVWQSLFQLSFDQHTVPEMWKKVSNSSSAKEAMST